MELTDWIADARNVVFLVIALAMLGSSVMVVTSRNVIHAALMLVVALAGAAALFLMLGAEFVAWTIVLVYIGAVIVLFLFGIMITRAPTKADPVRLDHKRRWPALIVALGTFATMATVTTMAFGDTPMPDGVSRSGDLGDVLFTRFVIPFEVVSFVLLAALIGGIVLARKDPQT
ncbi:MAG: NADH-quinone oxidoreductase subunit J [Actinomycetota bacterium]